MYAYVYTCTTIVKKSLALIIIGHLHLYAYIKFLHEHIRALLIT